MYSLTLEINQKCNLSCIYCYLGEKDKSEMPLETATKSIDLAFNNTKIHRDKKIWIDFIGGEPLLDFGYILIFNLLFSKSILCFNIYLLNFICLSKQLFR